MSVEEREERYITFTNVQINSLHPDQPFIPYFTVVHNGEIIRVRTRVPENFALLKEHKGQSLDLTVFPYPWTVNDKSGVVYYFQHFKVHEED
jgi:hypothetical protein